MFFSKTIEGPLKYDCLNLAFNRVMQRHAMLRARLFLHQGQVMQRAECIPALDIPVVDLTHLSPPEQDEQLQRLAISHECNTFFIFNNAPLFVVQLFKMHPLKHVIFFTLPHIICDEISVRLMWRQISTFYNCLAKQEQSIRLPVSPQFLDFVLWEQDVIASPYFKTLQDYWDNEFKENFQYLALPSKIEKPESRTYLVDRIAFCVDPVKTSLLKTLSFRQKTTPACALLAVFYILLRIYSNQNDIVIGFPFSGRRFFSAFVDIFGPMAGISPIRFHVDDLQAFTSMLKGVHRKLAEAYDYQFYPLELILKGLNPVREQDGAFALRVMFNKLPEREKEPGMVDLAIRNGPQGLGRMHFDICLYVTELKTDVKLELTYDVDRFCREMMEQIVRHYQELLSACLADPALQLSKIIRISTDRLEQDFQSASSRAGEPPPVPRFDGIVIDLFKRQVVESPHIRAIQFKRHGITYKELDERSDWLAKRLQEVTGSNEKIVGIVTARSIQTVVSILAVIKTGKAYLPIEKTISKDRMFFMLQSTGTKTVVLEPGTRWELARTGIKSVVAQKPENISDAAFSPPSVSSEDPAYVLFTSGSTGLPKPVAVAHRTLLNLVLWNRSETKVPARGLTAQFASFSFDVSIQEIFLTLCFGGTLSILSYGERINPHRLLRHLKKNRINRLFLPYTMLKETARAHCASPVKLPFLKEVVTAGEQLVITREIRAWFKQLKACILVNQYGPTESHVVTWHTLDGDPENWPRIPPIGRPIRNVSISIRDAFGNRVPCGVVGEIWIAGDCLALGYFGDQELNREKFVEHSDSDGVSQTWYKTGDLARRDSDGVIYFIGRNDNQIKLRGYRIEPGEVESVLVEYPLVIDAVVKASKIGEHRFLIAYLLTESQIAKQDRLFQMHLRNFLKKKLPTYMVPSRFIFVNDLKRTLSEKIDRSCLPEPASSSGSNISAKQAESVTEKMVFEVWQELLQVHYLGAEDNFFDVGGDSIMGLYLADRLSGLFHIRLEIPDLINHPTIRELAAHIDQRLSTDHAKFAFGSWFKDRLSRLFRKKDDNKAVKHDGSNLRCQYLEWIMPLRKEGDRRPLFLVPGGGGGKLEAFVYAQMINYVEPERPVYQLMGEGRPVDDVHMDHVGRIASDFIEAIKSVQSSGPYILVGECIGGIIAFEMARILAKRGDSVGRLILMDTLCPVIDKKQPALYQEIKREIEAKLLTQDYPLLIPRSAYYLAALRYIPERYEHGAILIASEETAEADRLLGWGPYIGGMLSVVKTPGDHLSYIRDYHNIAGETLNRCIAGQL